MSACGTSSWDLSPNVVLHSKSNHLGSAQEGSLLSSWASEFCVSQAATTLNVKSIHAGGLEKDEVVYFEMSATLPLMSTPKSMQMHTKFELCFTLKVVAKLFK